LLGICTPIFMERYLACWPPADSSYAAGQDPILLLSWWA
jgi:hypothetical protein